MRIIKNYLHLDIKTAYSVCINHFESDNDVDPDWPEFVLCEDYDSAELLKNTLNAISYKDCSDLLLSEEPYLTQTELKSLWVELKAPQYTVHPVNYTLLDEHLHRVPLSMKSLKLLIPEIEFV